MCSQKKISIKKKILELKKGQIWDKINYLKKKFTNEKLIKFHQPESLINFNVDYRSIIS